MSHMRISKEKVEMVKEVLKSIHRGESVEELKKKFRSVLAKVSPFEIPLIEQELVKEGVKIADILKLCDLHVEMFREFLKSRELKGVPKGHPIDLLMKENEFILKQAELLGIYTRALLSSKNMEETRKYLETIRKILDELKKVKMHYRKVQMLIFPYLERRGIIAVPRVLWGREDKVIVKIREAYELLNKAISGNKKHVEELANKVMEIGREISELVFRENKILYPATWALLSEGEWALINEIGKEIGYIVKVDTVWKPKAKPILPYEIESVITPEQVEKLPRELRFMALKTLTPDTYKIKKSEDLDLETGFLNVKELKAIFKTLPAEITYANADDRVKFFTQTKFHKGFTRTKTIIGRKIEFCHPPRLEGFVKMNVNMLKKEAFEHREFWTKVGDRIIRVIIASVKGENGEYLGTLEIVEDLTDVINNAEDIKKKILVL